MLINVLTLFPRMIEAPLAESILGKAQQKGLFTLRVTDIRDHALNKHKNADDVPYGGGAGMVMKPEPLVSAIEAAQESLLELRSQHVAQARGAPTPETMFDHLREVGRPRVVLMSPGGTKFDQSVARRLSQEKMLILVCGRYEGVDERVMPWIDEQISLGDFVLTGGEFAALTIIDSVVRLLPGVLGNEQSAQTESFAPEGTVLGALEHPHYTRPPEFRGMNVPPLLMSGDHARIARWRRTESLLRTRARRPDLFEKLPLTAEDKKLLAAADAEAAREAEEERLEAAKAPPPPPLGEGETC
ncbi:MAG: tRNA (guanosine(37)-N1)-methyltransferase TrmD [Deltaproteobacteria bacterium]|nr:tRNA (guanosine(37)-N1)-methyltransferase TrmD [Deltaproteobacteria bacterium]